MASSMTNAAKAAMATAYLAGLSSLKFMLLKTSYSFNPDHEFVSSLTSHEIVATNYTGGFGGAGRKTAGTPTVVKDNTNDRAHVTFADKTWTALGGASNDTIGYVALINEVTNDAASPIVGIWDLTDTTTNGSDVTLDFDGANGNLWIT
jgi:hypothetical protein